MKPRWLCVMAALAAAAALQGCATWDAAQKIIAERGAKAADEQLESIEWGLCRQITVGAWVRRFGQSPELAQAWRGICSPQIKEAPSP